MTVTVSNSNGYVFGSATVDPATGAYLITDLPASSLSVRFDYLGTGNFVTPLWNASAVEFTFGTITFTEGETKQLDRQLVAGASVSGVVTGVGGEALTEVSGNTQNWQGLYRGRTVIDEGTGEFYVDRLAAGTYNLNFTSTEKWRTTWYQFTVTAGQALTGIQYALDRSTAIEGTVLLDDGSPAAGVDVFIRVPSTGLVPKTAQTDAEGHYAHYNVPVGSYEICAGYSTPHVFPNCYGDQPMGSAPTVAVTNGQVVTGKDFSVRAGASFEGRAMFRLSEAASPTPLATGKVTVYREADEGWFEFDQNVMAGSDGTFAIGPLELGNYVLRFSDESGALNSEYWEDARYFGQSDVLSITAPQTVDLGDIVLEPRYFDVDRLNGADRFDVGVLAAQAIYPDGSVPVDGVPVVYIANGYNFPDALTAGPAAGALGGVVLLVTPASIPDSVKSELERLSPQKIVVAGGPVSVSPAVVEELQEYVEDPADVSRAGGADRFEASRNIVAGAFDSATVAIVATAWNFPDALSAGPAATLAGGPVLLVDGRAGALDEPTMALLDDLGIEEVYIAGGTASVSPGIEASLQTLLGYENVHRLAGADRFEVGALIRQEFFAQSDLVFLATGYKFPDALTGGPLAAAYGAPLYLSRPDCVPLPVALDILEVDAQGIILLGGSASLGTGVENLQVC